MATMGEEKMYFLHIPKTAGTSVGAWMQAQPGFRVCPQGLWSQLLRQKRETLEQYNVFAGHFYTYLDSYVNVRLKTFTFLRHPVDRSVSHYLHILRDDAHYLHRYTRRLGSFLHFMRDPLTRPMIANFQTRALSMQFDIVKLFRKHQWFAGRYRLERHIESDMDDYTSDNLARAMRYLDRCCCAVGITEQMELSMRKLKKALGTAAKDDAMPFLNTARNAARCVPSAFTLSGEEYNLLISMVSDDMALYEYATSLLHASQ